MVVAIQLSVLGLYLPPVFFSGGCWSYPPQTIISAPVHAAVCPGSAPSGALLVAVAIQLFVFGLYLPPVFELTL